MNGIIVLLNSIVGESTNLPLFTIESPLAQWLEHPARSQRVVNSYPIGDSDFYSESETILDYCYLEYQFVTPYNLAVFKAHGK